MSAMHTFLGGCVTTWNEDMSILCETRVPPYLRETSRVYVRARGKSAGDVSRQV